MTRLFESKAVNTFIEILCALIVVTAIYVGVVYFKADVVSLLIFLGFIIFYVLVPGLLLLKVLKIRSSYFSVNISSAFFAGFAFILAVYFISDFIGSDLLLYVLGPLFSLLYMVSNRKAFVHPFKSSFAMQRHAPSSIFIFFTLVFVYSVITTQYTYIPPSDAAFSAIKLDFGFHAGIVNALAKDFPPRNPWVSGIDISYHLFTELLYSIPVRLFSLCSEEILLSCTPYIIAPLMTFSLYGFFKEFASNKDRCGLYCISLVISNMFMLKAFTASWFLYHLFSNINNAGMGTAAVLVMFTLLKHFDDVKSNSVRLNINYLFLLSILVMLTTGIKGPAALVFVSGLFGTMMLATIMKKANCNIIVASVLSCISFAFIYVYILGSLGSGQTNGKGESVLNPWEVTDIFFLKNHVLDIAPRYISLPILLIVFMLFTLTAFALPFTIGYVRELFLVLSKRKEFIFSKVAVYATCMVGFIALMMFNFNGHSQVYFGFIALILVPVIAFWYLEDVSEKQSLSVRFIRLCFFICLCVTALTVVMNTEDYISAARKKYENRNSSRSLYREVSAPEYDALIWLKNNTEEDALIASDRYFSVSPAKYDYRNRSHNTHFAYAIYSQREQYLEGSGFSLRSSDDGLRKEMIENLKLMMDPANDERDELARSLSVDYIMISKRFNNAGDLSSSDYTLVFSNDDVDIYRVEIASKD